LQEPGFNSDTSTKDKPECKEPSNLPFKQILAGASPVRFSNSKRECKAAGALGFSIRSHRVRLSTRSPIKASMAKRQTRWFERPVSRDVPVRFWLEAPVMALWWNSRHTALRTQRLRTCGCNSCQGYQSVWVEAEVVQAEHCECSVSGCESRRSNQYHAVAERRGRRLQPVSRTFKPCRRVQISGYSVVVASDAWNVVASVRFRVP
jgi:hypothetical protein